MAIKFEKIKQGMTLYDVKKSCERRWKWSIWPVFVIEIDTKQRCVLASWYYDKPKWMSEKRITKFRAKRPVQVYS